MLSWVRCAGTLNVKITIKHLNLDSRLKKTGYSKSGKTVVSSNTGPYSCWKKLHCVYLLSLFNTMTIYHFLIRQTWSDLLPWIICCILAFSGEQHLQLKWGASDNNVYCKYDSSCICLFSFKMSFTFFFWKIMFWCDVPSYVGFFQGVRDAAVELLHTLVAVHAEVNIACHLGLWILHLLPFLLNRLL